MAILIMWPRPFIQTLVPLSKGYSISRLTFSAEWFQRRTCLIIVVSNVNTINRERRTMEHGCTLSSHFQYHDSGALLQPGSTSELCLVRPCESGSAERTPSIRTKRNRQSTFVSIAIRFSCLDLLGSFKKEFSSVEQKFFE